MPRDITPIKTSGNPSFPLASGLNTPYNSRVEDELIFDTGETPKNYQFIGFRPGFPLQASELNEIQEHYQLQLTLTINMMNNWITSGAGPLWAGSNQSHPGDGVPSGNVSLPYNTGIGIGGIDGGGHDSNLAISGPGWRGATPLYPFASPYSGSDSRNPVDVELLSNGHLKITITPGWWCVELPQQNPSSTDPNNQISGLKHWIWIESSLGGFTPDPSFQIDVDVSGSIADRDIEIPVGLEMQSLYYRCCTETTDPSTPCDPDLGDNAAGFANPVACGGSRYAINAIGASVPSQNNWPTDGSGWNQNGIDEWKGLSLICTINPKLKTIRYMNNILLYKW